MVGPLWMVVPLYAAATGGTVEQAVARFDQLSARVPAPLGHQFRTLAAKGLQARHCELAQKLVEPAGNTGPTEPRLDPASTKTGLAIVLRLSQFSRLPTDTDRAQLLIELASEIGALPGKGLIVLAVTDERRETILKFLADKNYTFPILLDSDRRVNTDFDIGGVPQTFVFDREGELVAHAIDIRTESQFRAMLKAAGLE
jgi:hypothetical protein